MVAAAAVGYGLPLFPEDKFPQRCSGNDSAVRQNLAGGDNLQVIVIGGQRRGVFQCLEVKQGDISENRCDYGVVISGCNLYVSDFMVLVFGITQGRVRIKRPLSHRNALKFDMCAHITAADEEFPVTVRA